MRKLILASTLLFLGPTALVASTTGGVVVGEPTGVASQKPQDPSDGLAAGGQGRSLEGDVILTKGDKTGTGGGHGGHKGAKKGGNHGKQKHDKS